MNKAVFYSGLILLFSLSLAATETGRVPFADESLEPIRWYLPAGGSLIGGEAFDTYILIANPVDEDSDVEVKRWPRPR